MAYMARSNRLVVAAVDGDISFYELSTVAATSASLRGLISGSQLRYAIPHCVSYAVSRDEKEVCGAAFGGGRAAPAAAPPAAAAPTPLASAGVVHRR
jgi:hypothetical protein